MSRLPGPNKILPDAIATVYEDGATQAEIAETYRTTPKLVRRELRRMGVEMRPARARLKAGPDAVDARIAELRERGLSFSQIGQALRRSQQAVQRRDQKWNRPNGKG
jgi:IS30 family transposase